MVKDGAWAKIRSTAAHAGERYALFVGDARTAMRALPAASIHTCLTSPPYWSARDYEHKSQIGLEDSVEEYVEQIVSVFREVWRVLANDGTAWLNLGDCYLHQIRQSDQRWQRNKQLALVPFRVALRLQEDGWLVRNVAVWQKPNAMPASVRDRLTNTWEPVFLLSKAEQYYFNLDAIREPHKTDDLMERRRAEGIGGNGKATGLVHMRQWLNSPRHRANIDGLKVVRRRPNAPDCVELAAYLRRAAEAKGVDIKWVARELGAPFERTRHYFRTDRVGSRLPPEETWDALKRLLNLGTEFDDAMEVEVGDNVFRNHPLGRNPGDVRSVAVTPGPDGHYATMPKRLALWTLQATLPTGGVCLDPFMGIGTSGLAALELGGRFVGVDVRSDFVKRFRKVADRAARSLLEELATAR